MNLKQTDLELKTDEQASAVSREAYERAIDDGLTHHEARREAEKAERAFMRRVEQ